MAQTADASPFLATGDNGEATWLSTVYVESTSPCPPSKRVKVSDVHAKLEQRYNKKYSNAYVSELIHQAFPNATIKICGKSRTKHLFGVLPINEGGQFESGAALTESSAELKQLLELERGEKSRLHQEIALLQARVKELEVTSSTQLSLQVEKFMSQKSSLTVCGPDTYEHFQKFSIDGVIHELREQIPEMYSFFMELGNVNRSLQEERSTSLHECKAVSSLCTLLNARCAKVKGLQL